MDRGDIVETLKQDTDVCRHIGELMEDLQKGSKRCISSIGLVSLLLYFEHGPVLSNFPGRKAETGPKRDLFVPPGTFSSCPRRKSDLGHLEGLMCCTWTLPTGLRNGGLGKALRGLNW